MHKQLNETILEKEVSLETYSLVRILNKSSQYKKLAQDKTEAKKSKLACTA